MHHNNPNKGIALAANKQIKGNRRTIECESFIQKSYPAPSTEHRESSIEYRVSGIKRQASRIEHQVFFFICLIRPITIFPLTLPSRLRALAAILFPSPLQFHRILR
jgi:hypothetical protein